MSTARLGGIDLNLLVALGALLRERNVTHAGASVAMSQPAMSGALARLRTHFGDELLRRTGRGYELTPLAEKLLPLVEQALRAVADVLRPDAEFEPTTSTRRFTLSVSDYAMGVLVEPLLGVLHEQAPGVSVDFDPIPPTDVDMTSHLLRRDAMIAALGYGLPGRRQVMFSDRFVCIVAAGNPRLRGGTTLTLADLAGLRHAGATFGPGTLTPADRVLAAAGVERQVEVTVQGLMPLPFIVAGTDLCAFVPERLARRCATILDLVVTEVPLPTIELVEAAHWHPSRTADPSLAWFRRVLAEASRRIAPDA
ncbi:MAG TPA: LysR family transcriptional regulator [Rugosimonospora sp.]|nr:LysR family transcriptional regulator [Rugosimonospora sp.]